MPKLMLICTNCGKIFPSGIQMNGGASAALLGNKSKCPHCGSWVSIPDGAAFVLSSSKSIVLPSFDTSAILGSKTQSLTLSLYVLGTQTTSSKIQVAINPYDPKTKIVRDGLSSFINPEIGKRVDFQLPRELFEQMVGTSEQLLITLFGNDNQEIIFAGPEMTGTEMDPILSGTSAGESASSPPIINNFYTNIENSQLHFGQGDIQKNETYFSGNKPVKRWWEASWFQILALLGALAGIIALVIYFIE